MAVMIVEKPLPINSRTASRGKRNIADGVWELLAQVIALLQRQGRVSYGALKRRFHLDDDYLENLKVELIEAQSLAADEQDRILVWLGSPAAAPLSTAPSLRDTAEAPLASTAGSPRALTWPTSRKRRCCQRCWRNATPADTPFLLYKAGCIDS
jgi:hypothetical protein